MLTFYLLSGSYLWKWSTENSQQMQHYVQLSRVFEQKCSSQQQEIQGFIVILSVL